MSTKTLYRAQEHESGRRTRVFLEIAFFALSAFAAIALILSLSACGTKNPFKRGPEEKDTNVVTTPDTNVTKPDTNTGGNDTTTGNDTSTTADEDTPTLVSYENEVYPILESGCKSCHSGGLGGFKVSGDPAGDYSVIIGKVDTANPSSSVLLEKGTGSVSHGGGTLFDVGSAEYNTILNWITQGAKQN